MKPRILITNDDGIFAEGLRHVWQALFAHCDISIIAPESEQSGVGLGITFRQPLMVGKVRWEKETAAWKVNGTPADCVRLGLSTILDQPPDLIISGINRGSNSGRNLLYSGTVGGVVEGALRGIPGIALSCVDFTSPNYEEVTPYILPLIQELIAHPLPSGTFLNINFPHCSPIHGIKLARQGMGYWIEDISERKHPEGHPYYWMGGKWVEVAEEENSDVYLLRQGYGAAVPVNVNEMTDHGVLKQRKERFDGRFKKHLINEPL